MQICHTLLLRDNRMIQLMLKYDLLIQNLYYSSYMMVFMLLSFLHPFSVDPVKVLDHVTDAPDSLIKFLLDVFSSQTTSEIFYTNDMKVLIGIIVRQLTDLSPGNQVSLQNRVIWNLLHVILSADIPVFHDLCSLVYMWWEHINLHQEPISILLV